MRKSLLIGPAGGISTAEPAIKEFDTSDEIQINESDAWWESQEISEPEVEADEELCSKTDPMIQVTCPATWTSYYGLTE